MMFIKVFVFDGDGRLGDVFGQVADGYRRPVLVGVDFVKQFAVSVQDFGGDRKLVGTEFARRRQAGKDCHQAVNKEQSGRGDQNQIAFR